MSIYNKDNPIPQPTNTTGSPFKGDRGVLMTRSLFFETQLDRALDRALYTLKDHDHTWKDKTYKSLYLLYMEVGDPTEYQFAKKYLDSWQHWELLCEANWFKPYVSRWRKELELRIKSETLAKIRNLAESGEASRDSFNAQKYLLDKGWEPKEKSASKRGRPTKEEIQKEAIRISQDISSIEEDYERIVNPQLN